MNQTTRMASAIARTTSYSNPVFNETDAEMLCDAVVGDIVWVATSRERTDEADMSEFIGQFTDEEKKILDETLTAIMLEVDKIVHAMSFNTPTFSELLEGSEKRAMLKRVFIEQVNSYRV